jgi:hypothetical protein
MRTSGNPRYGTSYPFQLPGPLGRWRPLDRWAAAYAAVTGLILAFGAARGLPGCAAQAGVSAGALAAILVLARLTADTRSAALTVLRLAAAPLLYWTFYHQIEVLWPMFRPAPLDGVLATMELRLWGCQPSLAFQALLPWRWLSEIFCFAYFSYYLFVPVLGLTVLARRGYLEAERIVLAATVLFYACYTFFWLAPTVGPHYWFPPGLGPRPYPGYLFNHLLYVLTSGGEIRAGAFPSSHVAVALLLTLCARRKAPALFPAMATVTALMLPAVVYLRAHYLVDVPAGLLTGLAAYRLLDRGGAEGAGPEL